MAADGLSRLFADAQACRRCESMAGRRRVLGPASGRPDARALFVAEAPGRFGGDRTGVPLTHDQTGRNFATLLEASGLKRSEVFVTNAVLCNPRDASGRNRPPARHEVEACRDHLRRLLDLLAAPTVVALGAVALRALAAIEPHQLELRRDVGRAMPWRGRLLVPLYHPGPRAAIHRPREQQALDFRALRTTIEIAESEWQSRESATSS